MNDTQKRIVIYDTPVYEESHTALVSGRSFQMARTKSGIPTYEFDSSESVWGLKVFESHGNRLLSTYRPRFGRQMEYRVGETYRQKVSPKTRWSQGSGIYLYMTTNIDYFLNGIEDNIVIDVLPINYAIGLCEAFGPFIAYDVDGCAMYNNDLSRAKKLAVSQLYIDKIVYTFRGW